MPIGRWSIAVLLVALAATGMLVDCGTKQQPRGKITYNCQDQDVKISAVTGTPTATPDDVFLCEGDGLQWTPDGDYDLDFDKSCLKNIPKKFHVSKRDDNNDTCVLNRPKCVAEGEGIVCTYTITATREGGGKSSDPHVILMPPGTL